MSAWDTFALIALVALWPLSMWIIIVASRTPRKAAARICVACGHERGWHQTYRPTRYPYLEGCIHRADWGEKCRCPAGRRSIR